MLDLVNTFISWRMKKRFHQIELFLRHPHEVQQELLMAQLHKARDTEWGRHYHFSEIKRYEEFARRVPLHTYEDLEEEIEELRQGAEDRMWPGKIKWFAKSSGTTNSRSKFIPVTQEAIEGNHFKAGKDLLSIYCHNFPETKIFSGTNLRLGGSTFGDAEHGSFYGDVSAILIEHLPFWVEMRSTPNSRISLMSEWEEKLEAMAHTSMKEDVTSLAGVPSWMLVLINRVLELSGKENLHQVWPNLEMYMHGGVNFTPYRPQYEALMDKPINYLDTYNASEGFFAIQDQPGVNELLLMLDYGIFYEFIPMDQFNGTDSPTVPLWEVERGKNYALVISSNAGLWRYLIGDTVRFTSLKPYRIQITGRTKHFINTFGEELIVENAETALSRTCEAHQLQIKDYTVAPVYMEGRQQGAHEWLIEFEENPRDLSAFAHDLDRELQKVNSDYEAKRYKNMALTPLKLNLAKTGLFYQWLKKKGKLGGQHKVPRLSNDRRYMDEMLKMNQ